jgi:hypothetical protein
MATRLRRITVIGTRTRGIATNEVADPFDSASEVLVRLPDAGVNDVGVNVGTIECSVELRANRPWPDERAKHSDD